MNSTFPCEPLGYVRHWLVAGPQETPYQGPSGEENVLRREALDQFSGKIPVGVEVDLANSFGQKWKYHYPGNNFFVELTSFYHCLTLVNSFASTEIVAEKDGEVPALFWVAGAADLWVNGMHLTRFSPIRYMYPDAEAVTLPLKKGVNILHVRLQCLGVRDTRILFGLQIKEGAGDLSVQLPGPDALRTPIVAAVNWLDGVSTEGRDTVVSSLPAPQDASILIPGQPVISWPTGKNRVSLQGATPFQLSVSVMASGQILKRNLEIPVNRPSPVVPAASEDFQRIQLEQIAAIRTHEGTPFRGFQGIPPLTARRLLKRTHADDATSFAAAILAIDKREDCADFGMAMLLRFYLLGLATPEESAEIKRAALTFRYWSDEPGTDAMCFWSENHSLLFHGCQRVAGLTFPDDVFSNTGKKGTEQAAIALERCVKWLDHVEPRGFDEFLSGGYMPVTILALLNLVDFSQDAEVSRRAAGLVDRIYRDLATHGFKGVTVGPQGRVYRDVLYPENSGTQSLLAYATREALPATSIGSWTVFVASSPSYQPPKDLPELIREPISKRGRQADVEIVLHKTRDYLLTSLSIPAPIVNEKGEPIGLQPGWGGYQQHIWQATLAPGCHVFVNHPGCSFDESKSRPGYWYGNGVLPKLTQHEGEIEAVYSIPDGSEPYPRRTTAEWFWPIGGCAKPYDLHPMPFTHAHWPSDAFDRQEVREHWAFGQKGSGYIALWCSAKLEPANDLLTGRELRAWAHKCTWRAICGSAEKDGTFEEFVEGCLKREK